MADSIPPALGASGPASFRSHDWHPYDSYLNIHNSYMERYQRDGTVLRDGISFIEIEGNLGLLAVNVVGIVICAEDVMIKVDKWLDVRRSRYATEVRGRSYVYHARLRTERRDLIRYCSAHGLDDLHCHHFDPRIGHETEQPRISLSELPTLGDFIPHAVELGRAARTSIAGK